MRIVPKIKRWVQDSKCESLRVYIVGRNNRRLVLHKTLLFPEKNRKDVMEDLTDAEREDVTIHFVRDVRQALELALEPAGEPLKQPSAGNKTLPGEGAVKLPEPKKPRPTKSPLPDVVPPVPPMH